MPRCSRRTAALTAAAPVCAVIGAYVIFDMPLTACVTAVWTLLALELFVPWTPSGDFLISLGAFSTLCWLTFVFTPEAGIYSGQRPGLGQGKRALLWQPWRYFTQSRSPDA